MLMQLGVPIPQPHPSQSTPPSLSSGTTLLTNAFYIQTQHYPKKEPKKPLQLPVELIFNNTAFWFAGIDNTGKKQPSICLTSSLWSLPWKQVFTLHISRPLLLTSKAKIPPWFECTLRNHINQKEGSAALWK